MTREMILEELKARGYAVAPQDTIKNGVSFQGILFQMDSNLSPVVYVQAFIDEAKENGKGIDDVVENILAQIEQVNAVIPSLNLEKFKNKPFVLTHLYIGFQRESEEPLVKKPSGLEGIESYLYSSDGNYFTKLNEEFMNLSGISVEEAWENAEKNTFKETEIKTMREVLKEMLGYDVGDAGEDAMYVVTNRRGIRGASAILDYEKVSAVAKKHGVNKLICLPSSVHEMIILPYEDVHYEENMDLEYFNNMVQTINCDEVAPEERLTDRAYVLCMNQAETKTVLSIEE